MNNIIHEIYNNFLLRDVIAKVVPGTVVLLSTAVLASARPPWELLRDIHAAKVSWPFLVLTACVSWAFGYVAQEIGRWPIVWGRSMLQSQTPIEIMFRLESKQRSTRRLRERRVVIKQATGNLFVAWLLLLAVTLVLPLSGLLSQPFRLALASALPLVALIRRHYFEVQQNTVMDDLALGSDLNSPDDR